jgi:hypothetical protein
VNIRTRIYTDEHGFWKSLAAALGDWIVGWGLFEFMQGKGERRKVKGKRKKEKKLIGVERRLKVKGTREKS